MRVEAGNDWISQHMSQMSEYDLATMFTELTNYKQTGTLPERALLRKVDREFRAHFQTRDSMLHIAEAAALFELGRLFNNMLDDARMATVEGWLMSCQDKKVTLYERGQSDEPWAYMVEAADWPTELQLGTFDDAESAKEFIVTNGYQFDGQIIDYGKGTV